MTAAQAQRTRALKVSLGFRKQRGCVMLAGCSPLPLYVQLLPLVLLCCRKQQQSSLKPIERKLLHFLQQQTCGGCLSSCCCRMETRMQTRQTEQQR